MVLNISDMKCGTGNFGKIMSLPGFTCLQQSVMNLGILMVQGVVNSFGTDVMAAFTVAVKSTVVCITAPWLMGFFVDKSKTGIISTGVSYLRTEGIFYVGIGILFMLYGYYRAVNCPVVSVILTIISLGTRVLLANVLSGIEAVGVTGIWVSIPIGWILADLVGIIYYFMKNKIDIKRRAI